LVAQIDVERIAGGTPPGLATAIRLCSTNDLLENASSD